MSEEGDLTYELDIELTEAQKSWFWDESRIKLVKAGRRHGKTKAAVRWLLIRALSRPGEMYWYVCPTFNMAKEIAWREFLNCIPRQFITHVSQVELQITLINGSVIALKSSDKEDRLRGRRLGAVVLDEAAFQKGHIWREVIQPMCLDLLAPALFISSPMKGWFTRMYNEAAKGTDPDMKAWHFTVWDNPHLSKM